MPGAAWRFLHASKYEGRNFGNAGVYATPRSVESLIRETAQNSLDAAVEAGITLRYSLVELSPGSPQRRDFLEALQFAQLKRHLTAAATGAGAKQIGVKLKSGIAAMESGSKVLRLLRVDDFGARGLDGDEFDSGRAFAALVRDNLNSQKNSPGAGGSFGIGSKTLWAASHVLTVLFSSVIHDHAGKGPRLIGKSDLSWHELDGGPDYGYSGGGWFGRPVDADGTESMWPADPDVLAGLRLDRKLPAEESRTHGTSALVVAFHEPKLDDQSGEDLARRLTQGLAENFWPAMVRGQLRGVVEHEIDGEVVATNEVRPEEFVPSYVDAYARHERDELCESLERPGDVVSVPITLEVPPTKPEGGISPEHPQSFAECRLVIRLADPQSIDARLIDRVGFTRGRGMITEYVQKRNLAAGARPYHAVLLAGTAVGSDGPDLFAETFLRYCEPPAHDKWEANEDVRERYAGGIAKRLDEFKQLLVDALRKYVCQPATEGTDGPQALKDLFRIRRPPQAAAAKLDLVQSRAVFIDGAFAVEATVSLAAGAPRSFSPTLALMKESGKPKAGTWITLSCSNGTVGADGHTITANEGARRVKITGRSRIEAPGLDLQTCAVRLALTPAAPHSSVA